MIDLFAPLLRGDGRSGGFVEMVAAAADSGLEPLVEQSSSGDNYRPEPTSAKIIIGRARAWAPRKILSRRSILPVAETGAAVGASVPLSTPRLCAERTAGRPDRQGRRPVPLHRWRHSWSDRADRRHEGTRG